MNFEHGVQISASRHLGRGLSDHSGGAKGPQSAAAGSQKLRKLALVELTRVVIYKFTSSSDPGPERLQDLLTPRK